MSQSIVEERLRSNKEYLLRNNPSKINASNREEILTEFIQCFEAVFPPLKNGTKGLTDPARILIVDSLSIWVLRSTQLILNKKFDTSEYRKLISEDLLSSANSTIIFQYVIDFWSDGSTAFVNALRDMFTKLLRLIKLVHPAESCRDLLSFWLNLTLEISSTLRVQYYLIDSLSDEIDLFLVLRRRTDFIETSLSLMWSDSLSTPIGKCITSLLINIYNNHFMKQVSKVPEWLELWDKPLLEHLSKPKYRKSIELYILTPLFKAMPNEAFFEFSQKVGSATNSFQFISIFRLGQQLGIEEEPFHEDKLIPLKTIESFLKRDEYKLSAFELLTYSTKKSRPVNKYIFHIIRENIEIFFIDTEIETRNYFCSTFKHFILRIRDSSYSLNKTITSLKTANKFPLEQKEKLKQVEECEQFLSWLVEYIKTQITPGTQYQRNDAALRLLKVLVESGIDQTVSEDYIDLKNKRVPPFSIPLCSDLTLVRLLLDILSSHYDDIRQSAKYLLLAIFSSSNGKTIKKKADLGKIHQKSIEFLNNYQYSDIGAILQNFLYCISEDRMICIENLLNQLQIKTHKNKEAYFEHINYPISGYFTSLSMILNEGDLDNPNIKEVVESCISLIFENWNITKSFMCHDPTQGFLPSSYKGVQLEDQLLISSAFRTVKESSSLLKTILEKCPLTENQLRTLGGLLIEQLFSIYHSGAFQAVLPSFHSCCQRCHNENPSQLEKWLQEITDTLEVKTQYVTRRSGGIPFIISTILITESRKDHPLLNFAFNKLKSIASQPIEFHQDEVDLPQINAFNCIRAIFIESKLSEPCAPYIAPAMILSLRNFTSNFWALRNCSIMLFTSLQNRIFGKKGKNVGASQFFARYEGIREILLELFQSSLMTSTVTPDCFEGEKAVESIFLVLNILLRLKPTLGNEGLGCFVEKIVKCLGNENWKIRDMAARALAYLVDEPLEWSISALGTASISSQNTLHGILIAVTQILRGIAPEKYHSNEVGRLIDVVFSKQVEFISYNKCDVTIRSYIELAQMLLQTCNARVGEERIDSFLAVLGNFFVKNNDAFAVDGSKQLSLARACKCLLYHEPSMALTICELGMKSPYYEVQSVCLEFAVHELDLASPASTGLVSAILEIKDNADNLPSINALIMRAITKAESEQAFENSNKLMDPANSAEEQLAAIECLGQIYTSNEAKMLEKTLLKYSDDKFPVGLRLASLNCMQTYSEFSNQASLILRAHAMLSDDDDNVRTSAAELLYENFFPKKDFPMPLSPCVVAKELHHVIPSSFPHGIFAKVLIQILRDFLTSYNILTLRTNDFDDIFESEKDNQFRNEIEQNLQYVKILSQVKYDCAELLGWVIQLKTELLGFLQSQKIRDTPMGWTSNPEVFSRLCILRMLVGVTEPLQLDFFDARLRFFKLHPMIFELD